MCVTLPLSPSPPPSPLPPSLPPSLPQFPAQDDTLLLAFSCRDTIGPELWASCDHTHCSSVRDQWRHLITCGQSCPQCQAFQRQVLLHSAHCRQDGCVITLCPDAKDRLQSVNGRRLAPPLRSSSVQSSLGSPRPPQFLSLNSQGSLDDMSPMSPLHYPSFYQELVQIGAGTLPRHLQGTYSLRASEIMREMESDGPLDKFPPAEKTTPATAPAPPTSQGSVGSKYNPVGAGILSPIEEHPCGDEGKYPMQIILHPLEPVSLSLPLPSSPSLPLFPSLSLSPLPPLLSLPPSLSLCLLPSFPSLPLWYVCCVIVCEGVCVLYPDLVWEFVT